MLESKCYDLALGGTSSGPWIEGGELRASGDVLGSTPQVRLADYIVQRAYLGSTPQEAKSGDFLGDRKAI